MLLKVTLVVMMMMIVMKADAARERSKFLKVYSVLKGVKLNRTLCL